MTFVLALTLLPVWLIWQGLSYGSSVTATATPWVSIADYPVVVFPGQPATVTVAWGSVPTDGRYKLRVQLENKFQEPHVFYFPADLTHYNASETRTITISIPANASPRVASRFVAAFLSTTMEWGDVLAADFRSRDVTIESSPPTGWTSGRFRFDQPDARTLLDPQGGSFYVQGMIYAYEEVTGTLTAAGVISELARMKELGFNTVSLYPRAGFNSSGAVQSDFLPEILSWADHNRAAIYLRIWFDPWVEIPDFMDPQYRNQARRSLDSALSLIRPHPSVLAVDLDQRWLVDVSWSGVRRYGVPRLMTQTLAYLPTWLQDRYGSVAALNAAWDRHYIAFADVLSDADIVRAGHIVDFDWHPWRLDLVEYTLWAMDDFMKDVVAYARSVDPHHMFTYTNDRAQVIPFPRSTRNSSCARYRSRRQPISPP